MTALRTVHGNLKQLSFFRIYLARPQNTQLGKSPGYVAGRVGATVLDGETGKGMEGQVAPSWMGRQGREWSMEAPSWRQRRG